jgi:hypothetical protein
MFQKVKLVNNICKEKLDPFPKLLAKGMTLAGGERKWQFRMTGKRQLK